MQQKPDSGRRKFLNYLLGGGSLTFLGATIYPILKYLTPPELEDSSVEAVNVGKVAEFKNNSGRIVKFGSKPALVVRTATGEFKAFLAACTHLSCTVQYLPDDKIIWCACHNGKYDLNGNNVAGPPPRPLPPLRVNIQQDEVYIAREA